MATLFLIWSLLGVLLVWNVFRPLQWSNSGLFRFLSFSAGWIIGDLAVHWILLNISIVSFFIILGAFESSQGLIALAICLCSWSALGLRLKKLSTLNQQLQKKINKELQDVNKENTLPEHSKDLIKSPFDWKTHFKPTRLLRSTNLEILPNITFYQDRGIQLDLDIYRPSQQTGNSPILLQIHGGGWSFGSKNQGIPLMTRMVQNGWTCFSITYRKSPQFHFPDHIIDCKRALCWIKEHASKYGANKDFIVVTGGSAGGHLASLMALTPGSSEFQPGFEKLNTHVQGCVSFYGIYDIEAPFFPPYNQPFAQLLKSVIGGTPHTHPEPYRLTSPIRRIPKNPPPFLLLQGKSDALVSIGEAERFYQALHDARTPHLKLLKLPLLQHGFDSLPSYATHQVLPSVENYLLMLYIEFVSQSV